MIKVEGLTKRYARNVAVDHVSFEVEKGQIVGFLGPNGAGKTTTMRMLTCFMPPSEGTAEVAGFDILQKPMEVKKRLGYLPETPPLYPEMEVAEYLDFVGRIKGVPKSQLKVRIGEVMERCAIAEMKNRELGKLSKGYKQRVGLAQAILHNPDVLILDEPTSGLDPHQIKETRELIKQLAGDHTIVISTHILPEVEQICEHVVIIAKGKLVKADSLANLTSAQSGVTLEVLGDESASGTVHERLSKIDGVLGVHRSGGAPGFLRFAIDVRPEQPVRPEIAKAVVEAGWQLNELHAGTTSLESIYLKLTAADDTATVVDSEPEPAAPTTETEAAQ